MKNKINYTVSIPVMHSQHATQLATSTILHSHMVHRLKSKNLILQG